MGLSPNEPEANDRNCDEKHGEDCEDIGLRTADEKEIRRDEEDSTEFEEQHHGQGAANGKQDAMRGVFREAEDREEAVRGIDSPLDQPPHLIAEQRKCQESSDDPWQGQIDS